MGLFDDVRLTDAVREMARAQYRGSLEITADGWQSKCMGCGMNTVTLDVNGVTVKEDDATARYDDITREIRFYKSHGRHGQDWEWLEFSAMYVDGKLVAIRHRPEV